MTETAQPNSSDDGLGRWQYSLKSLLIVTTGVCVWASLAKVLYNACVDPNAWLMLVVVVWLGALLVQGCLHVWAWLRLRQPQELAAEVELVDPADEADCIGTPVGILVRLHKSNEPAAEIPRRFRASLFWGMVPLSLWLVLCAILVGPGSSNPRSGYPLFLGVAILHMALPTALLLAGSTFRGKDPFPLKVVRWAVVVSCLVPLTAVAIALTTGTAWW